MCLVILLTFSPIDNVPSSLQNVNLLMVACYRGKKTIYELLLERGASINETDSVSEKASISIYCKARNFTEHFVNYIGYLDLPNIIQYLNLKLFASTNWLQKFQC